MSRFTVYRADVDSPRLARALGKVPGVAVDTEPDADAESSAATAETEEFSAVEEPVPPTDEEDGGGLRETAPVPDTDGDAKSAAKTYGLLGLGASMTILGLATIGIWVYRRRSGDDDEPETPPPSTGESPVAPTDPSPEPIETELATSAEPESESPSPDLTIVRPDEETAAEPASAEEAEEANEDEAAESYGRTEGDRSEVEWTARERTPPTEPATTDAATELSETGPEATDADEETRPGESIDAAPLLGVTFVAASGAVVRWLQRGDEA